MNKIFLDSLKDLKKVLNNQKLGNKTKFYVSFEFTQVDWEKDVFGPYRDFVVFEESSSKVTEFTIRNWIEQIKVKCRNSSRECKGVTILFFNELS